MILKFLVLATILNGHDGKEPSDRLAPPGWTANAWGPEATRARLEGKLPPLAMTPEMTAWDRWGRAVLRQGDILFRRGDARIAFGYFPFSRFLANVTGSPFSHTGIVSIEDQAPWVYDITKVGVRRQPFAVWILDKTRDGALGVKRVRPEYAQTATKAVAFCRAAFEREVPFDYDLDLDDRAFYCVEMTEKAYRAAGLKLSDPIPLARMERVSEFPICIWAFRQVSNLTLDRQVFFPGNARHGIWSSPYLVTVYTSVR